MTDNPRAVFATRFGAIAATVGSAVGLGNIWRFPYEAGVHGGGAFLICYIAFLFILGVPVMLAEFTMGRHTRSNIFGAYRRMSPKGYWRLSGYLGILAAILILSFYSVVAGWTLEYSLHSMTGGLDFSDAEVSHNQFMELTQGWRPVVWTVLFLVCNFLILVRGVTKGIEKASNILMPLLFVLLVVFCIHSATLPGFGEGIAFLFRPDFSQITPPVLLGAMGQAFFSLSLGLGCMMTYASYFAGSQRLVPTATTTAALDLGVALLSGLIVFPAVFSFGLSPQAGPTLVFEVLPYIFSKLAAGAVWSSLFFILLFLASLTSTVSMAEIVISYLCQEKHMSRTKATVLTSAVALAGGVACALSFGPWSHATVFGMTVFNLFDYASSNVLLPLGGLIVSVYVGWKLPYGILAGQTGLTSGRGRVWLGALRFLLRWVCPAAITLIFLNAIGLI